MKYNIEEFNNLIKNRRSVFPKDYSEERVEDAIIQQMIENATWAPTHKLTEPWHFIVYTGEGLKTLANLQASVYKSVTEKDGTFKQERYENLLTKPMQSSHIIVVFMKRDEKKSLPEIEEVGAVFCAVENLYLTATAYGVGCYLSTGGITFFEESKEAFGMTQQDILIGFMHVGKIKTDAPKPPRKRSSTALKSTWVTDKMI